MHVTRWQKPTEKATHHVTPTPWHPGQGGQGQGQGQVSAAGREGGRRDEGGAQRVSFCDT